MTDRFVLVSEYWNSPESFSSILDLGKAKKLSLYLNISTSVTALNFGCIIDLIKQTDRIQSLAIHRRSFLERDPLSVEEMYSIIIRYVNCSKSRHLEVPVCNLNHTQMFLDCSRGLFSIRFCSMSASLTLEQIIAPMKTSIVGCSILIDDPVESIWTGERVALSSLQPIESLVEWTRHIIVVSCMKTLRRRSVRWLWSTWTRS